MKIKIDQMDIHYLVSGEENKETIILLHGWGASTESYLPIYQYFSKHYQVYAIDLPGFGKSSEPKPTFGVSEYANVIIKFCEKLKIYNPILMGHSFGGRVIIKMIGEQKFLAKQIVLIDSAGIKPKRSIKYYFKVYSYKLGKKIVQLSYSKEKADKIIAEKRKKSGSEDYQNASDILKQVFIRVVNEDLTPFLEHILVPTLLVWGEKDDATPVSDGKKMEKKIPDSGLVILKNAGHYSYLDNLNEFLIIVDTFLKGSETA